MRKPLALLLAFLLAAMLFAGAHPASAAPAAADHPVSVTDGQGDQIVAAYEPTAYNVCAVLKSHFDPLNNAYMVFLATYRTWLFQSIGLEYAIVQCLFVPVRSPNYGNLCQQAAWQVFPTVGPISVSQIVPATLPGGLPHDFCPTP
jgi:hypothetical protein